MSNSRAALDPRDVRLVPLVRAGLSPWRGGLALLSVVLSTGLAGCSDPAPAEEPCSGAACGGGGTGGGGEDSCPEHASASPCRFDGLDNGCPDGVCTLAAARCPGGERCCSLPLACKAPVGSRAGGIRCDEDDQCESGSCTEVTGVRSCLRPCTSSHDSCPAGQHCETVALSGGATTSTCVGGTADARDPEATICTKPSECPEGRVCKLLNGTLTEEGGATGLCVVPPAVDDTFESCAPAPGSGIDPGTHGGIGSESCEMGGLCWDGCKGSSSYACICSGEQLEDGSCRAFRCTGVCGRDSDCPDRTQCEGISVPSRDASLSFAVCRLPDGAPLDWACWDELDCCKDSKRADGGPCCYKPAATAGCDNPPVAAETTHCRFAAAGGRYMTRCSVPGGLAAAGAPCTGHGDCESGLCAEDGAAGLACAALCDVRFDRCGEIVPGTTCCPTPVTADGGPHCVPTCRTSCDAPAACEL